jgi:divalent metal cation (Fe/Co/Zn/Cd) transporter
MVTSFFQVGLECISRLNSGDHAIIELGLPAIIIMASTVVIKALCFLWCRLIKNSSVQALAQDAMTDIVFNIFSIIFPLGMSPKSPSHLGQSTNFIPVGFYAQLWWLDALGGLLLSMFVIFNWAQTSAGHIRNLTGAAATADERNVLLYLTMRFAKTILKIQGLQAVRSSLFICFCQRELKAVRHVSRATCFQTDLSKIPAKVSANKFDSIIQETNLMSRLTLFLTRT